MFGFHKKQDKEKTPQQHPQISSQPTSSSFQKEMQVYDSLSAFSPQFMENLKTNPNIPEEKRGYLTIRCYIFPSSNKEEYYRLALGCLKHLDFNDKTLQRADQFAPLYSSPPFKLAKDATLEAMLENEIKSFPEGAYCYLIVQNEVRLIPETHAAI